MLGILVAMALSACSITTKPSAEALTALDHPPPALQAKLARLLPAAVAWYWQTEQQYAPQGRLLTAKEQAIANKLGIVHPEQVRVVIILLKPDYAKDKTLLAHELVHVNQVERMGQDAFVKRYITEMEMVGYRHSPLELEAYTRQKAAWQQIP